ncbi:MAG TPA: hypothetical protein VGM62_15745 [Chthoniobacterales bacterium]
MKKTTQIDVSEVAQRYTDPDQFERFDAAVRTILAVPREEVLRREADRKKESALNPNRRGPKLKNVMITRGEASRAPVVPPPV